MNGKNDEHKALRTYQEKPVRGGRNAEKELQVREVRTDVLYEQLTEFGGAFLITCTRENKCVQSSIMCYQVFHNRMQTFKKKIRHTHTIKHA